MKKISEFLSKNFHFLVVKFSVYLKRLVFVMDRLTELGFNGTSILVDHFVSSPREWEERDRRDSRGDEREGQGRKENE